MLSVSCRCARSAFLASRATMRLPTATCSLCAIRPFRGVRTSPCPPAWYPRLSAPHLIEATKILVASGVLTSLQYCTSDRRRRARDLHTNVRCARGRRARGQDAARRGPAAYGARPGASLGPTRLLPAAAMVDDQAKREGEDDGAGSDGDGEHLRAIPCGDGLAEPQERRDRRRGRQRDLRRGRVLLPLRAGRRGPCGGVVFHNARCGCHGEVRRLGVPQHAVAPLGLSSSSSSSPSPVPSLGLAWGSWAVVGPQLECCRGCRHLTCWGFQCVLARDFYNGPAVFARQASRSRVEHGRRAFSPLSFLPLFLVVLLLCSLLAWPSWVGSRLRKTRWPTERPRCNVSLSLSRGARMARPADPEVNFSMLT